MYGYVRPLKGELKLSEYEDYRAVYCGLCHELRRQGGFFARFVVNYDFTFLTMLLSGSDKPLCEKQRCPARLGGKCRGLIHDDVLEASAKESLILAWWKIDDGIRDSGFFKALAYRALRPLLRKGYRKAQADLPEFASVTESQLAALRQLEEDSCSSLDRAADCFAQILQAAALPEKNESRRRILSHLLYHLGRIVYILDAADDLTDDVRAGNYNPLIYRFSAENLTDTDRESLRTTLTHSQQETASAFELLKKNAWSAIEANTLFYGLPWTIEAVLCGEWKRLQKIRPRKQERI